MEIKILASTKPGYAMNVDEAIDFSGKSAGICYLPNTTETLFNEPAEKTLKRAKNNIVLGHHSVFGHAHYNLLFEGIPKILAMILNNEKVYNTSEKSARYTHMVPCKREKKLYEKWIEIYKKLIIKEFPNIKEKSAEKLALENARYLISIFTPSTIMEYTVSFEQFNYIISWARDYIQNDAIDAFSLKLKSVFKEFLKCVEAYHIEVDGLNSKNKKRKFSLFSDRAMRYEEFGENYSTTYLASFAELAQAQRHRTLNYEMSMLKENEFYVPPIIKATEFEKEWLYDMYSIEDLFPQGMLVKVNERGTIENFVLKCTERLCGCAQLEIMEQTNKTLQRYLIAVEGKQELYDYLLPYSKGARCTFPGWKCVSPCMFAGKNALNRIV